MGAVVKLTFIDLHYQIPSLGSLAEREPGKHHAGEGGGRRRGMRRYVRNQNI